MSDQANKILSFLCIILLVFLVFSILLFGKKKYDDPPKRETKTEEKEEEKKEEKEEEKPKVCSGMIDAVYEGNYTAQEGDFTLNENVTVTLKSDGSIEAVYKDSEGMYGTYTLENNKLVAKYRQPVDEIVEMSYDVAEDCSSIHWGDPNQHIITTKESKLGIKYNTFNILKNTLVSNGFEKSIFEDNNGLINSELHDVVCSKKIRSF